MPPREADDDLAAGSPTQVRWVIFVLACLASFTLYLHRYTWNIVGPNLQADLNLNHTQTQLLFSLFYWTYACGQIPSGVFIDRFGPHRFLSTIIAAWSGALVLIAQTSSMVLLGGARFLFGITQAGCYPALNKLTRVWFPARQRTMLQGLIATTSGRAGGAMSPIILGSLLMGEFGMSWQSALTLLGLVGIALCVAVRIGMRNSPDVDTRVNDAERAWIRSDEIPVTPSAARDFLPVRQALRNSSLRWFTVQQFLDAGSDLVFVGLIGTYFLKVHELDIQKTGLMASLPLWGGAIGGIAGGFLNDYFIRQTGNRRWSRSGVGSTGKIIGCAMLVITLFQTDGLYAGLFLMMAKFFSDWSQPTTWGTCTDLGGRYSATVFSIINTAGTLGGAVMPLVFGQVLDHFSVTTIVDGNEVTVTNWVPLFALLATMYFLSGLVWLRIDCTKKIGE